MINKLQRVESVRTMLRNSEEKAVLLLTADIQLLHTITVNTKVRRNSKF